MNPNFSFVNDIQLTNDKTQCNPFKKSNNFGNPEFNTQNTI